MKPRYGWIAVALLASTLGSSAAAAELQHGQQIWPGKLMLGVRPLGVQVFLVSGNDFAAGGYLGTYKFAIDFSGKIWETPKLTLWLGGEFNLGGRGNLAQIELGAFAMLTLEKLITKIPLVPLVSAGLTFPINAFYGFPGSPTLGGFGLKIGGGAYYFLLKMLGVGGEMHFAFAGAFGSGISQWLGYWDLVGGIRLAF